MQLVGRKGEVRGIPVASAEGSHILLLLGAGERDASVYKRLLNMV